MTGACTSFILVFCAIPTVLDPSFKAGTRLYLTAVTAVGLVYVQALSQRLSTLIDIFTVPVLPPLSRSEWS